MRTTNEGTKMIKILVHRLTHHITALSQGEIPTFISICNTMYKDKKNKNGISWNSRRILPQPWRTAIMLADRGYVVNKAPRGHNSFPFSFIKNKPTVNQPKLWNGRKGMCSIFACSSRAGSTG
ncbi:hypothetical protein GDO78_022262 [Eleutherodactylus coqui]|uniref:Uncharacterized protein n=1 Tax=Eleutherodactylus coqui TaxID=57060 RepID=A0A8J6B4T6_ELECQ|nr:hypothetical protein GDO78_022262 [Eleutherodactylus coqui]